MRTYRRKKIGLAAAAAAIMLLAAACGSPAAPESSATPAPTATPAATAAPTEKPTPAPTATPAPAPKAIGTEATGEAVLSAVLENGAGQDITGVAVKDAASDAFPENMLKADDAFAAGEKRTLFYDTAGAASAEGKYDIQITLKDETAYVLHVFPFGAAEAYKVVIADNVAYIEYTAASSGQAISTQGDELALVNAAAVAETYGDYQSGDDEYPDYATWGEGGNDEPTYDEPVYEEPAPEPEAPAAPEPPAGGGDEGCINGALFN